MPRAQPRRIRTKRPGTLILCEGHEAEPNYLDALAREKGLTSLSIPRNHNTDPDKLAEQAIQAIRRDAAIQRAFVVVDTIEHDNYEDALRRIHRSSSAGAEVFAVPSYPCFELWLLLHFEYTRAPMDRHEALARLKAHVPHYKKGSAQVMDDIIIHLDKAMENAERSWADAIETRVRTH